MNRYVPYKTSFLALEEEIEVLYEPSAQSTFAFEKAFAKYHELPFEFDWSVYRKCVNSLIQVLGGLGVRTVPLDFDATKEYRRLSHKSSPCWPFNLRHVDWSKLYEDPDFILDLSVHYDKFMNGDRTFLPFSLFLKDELLPIEKVQEGRTRMVSGSHAVLTHFMCSLSAVFNALVEEKFPMCAVGFTPFYSGWSKLFKGYGKKRSFDGKRFDTRMHDQELWEVCRIREELLSSNNPYFSDLLRACYAEVIDAYGVDPNGHVRKIPWGNKSGQFNTTVDNTLVNVLRWCYYFVVSGLGTPDEFFHTSCRFYGDDCLIDENLELAIELAVAHGAYEETRSKCNFDPVFDKDLNTGVVFCGFTSARYKGRLLPVFSEPYRLSSAAHFVKKNLNSTQLVERLCGLKLLAVGKQEVFDQLGEMVNKSGPTPDQKIRNGDTREFIINHLYLGFEGLH